MFVISNADHQYASSYILPLMCLKYTTFIYLNKTTLIKSTKKKNIEYFLVFKLNCIYNKVINKHTHLKIIRQFYLLGILVLFI